MRFFIVILGFITSNALYAVPPGQWECKAFDSLNRSYSATAPLRVKAIDKAYAKCRNNSNNRGSCRTAQSFCTQGPLALFDTECLVSDNRGRTFQADGVKPCRTAVSYCNRWQFRHGNSRGSACVVRHLRL